MPKKLNPLDDPVCYYSIKKLDRAYKNYKRTLLELRKYYLNTNSPDLWESAILQENAHQAEASLTDARAEVSKMFWEFAPKTNDAGHIKWVKAAIDSAIDRISKKETRLIEYSYVLVRIASQELV